MKNTIILFFISTAVANHFSTARELSYGTNIGGRDDSTKFKYCGVEII